jgi:hypothetical protein
VARLRGVVRLKKVEEAVRGVVKMAGMEGMKEVVRRAEALVL